MDVSDPSNFIRIQKIYNNDLQKLRKNISGYSFNDNATKDTIFKLYNSYGYIIDPHSSIGYLGIKEYLKNHQSQEVNGIFISTAHAIKFKSIVEKTINTELKYPRSLKKILTKENVSTSIDSYSELKEFLLNKPQ